MSRVIAPLPLLRTGSRPRCVVVDDHPALLHVLEHELTEHEVEIVATAADGRRAVDAVRLHHPDVIVADYRLPHLEGAPLVAALHEAAPDARIVVYTADADEELCKEALAAGATAVVLKASPLADLRRAIEAVLTGKSYLDPTLAPYALANRPAPASLTPREVDVLTLLAEGLSHEEIGARLEIGSETVRTHVRKASDRLGAATRTQAVATALRKGLIA